MMLVLRSSSMCLNEGPALPMLLCLHPVYKMVLALTAPVLIFERATAEYLRVLVA